MLGGLDALERVLPLLGRIGINREVALRIYTEVRASVAAGKPMNFEQIIARLKELGVNLDRVNFPLV
jgi:hypothetical protein